MIKKPLLILFTILGVLFTGSEIASSDNNVSLREYIDSRINAIERATALALDANEKRLDGMNEFRATLKDQAMMFVPRSEFKTLQEDVQGLKETRAEMAGKASQQSVLYSYFMAAFAIIVSVVTLYRRRNDT